MSTKDGHTTTALDLDGGDLAEQCDQVADTAIFLQERQIDNTVSPDATYIAAAILVGLHYASKEAA